MNKGTMFTLETICNKKLEEITKKDLSAIEQIGVSTKNLFGEQEDIDFQELFEVLPNLKILTIREKEITPEDIELLAKSNLIEIDFIKCTFSDEKLISKLSSIKKIIFRNCTIKDYQFLGSGLEELEALYVENPSDETTIDLSLIANKDKLEKIVLQRCLISNLKAISRLKLKLLSLLWTDIETDEIGTIANIPTLEKVFISEKYKAAKELDTLNQEGKIRTNLNEFFVEKEDEKRL